MTAEVAALILACRVFHPHHSQPLMCHGCGIHRDLHDRKDELMAKLRTIQPSAPGEQPISFHPGGLHQSLGVPQGQPIPAKKRAAALSGRDGAKAQRQAQFAKNVLTGGR